MPFQQALLPTEGDKAFLTLKAMIILSFSDCATWKCGTNGSTPSLSSATMKGTRCVISMLRRVSRRIKGVFRPPS